MEVGEGLREVLDHLKHFKIAYRSISDNHFCSKNKFLGNTQYNEDFNDDRSVASHSRAGWNCRLETEIVRVENCNINFHRY